MAYEQKVAARANGTTTVTVHPVGASSGVESKLARHAREGRTQAERASELEAQAKSELEAQAKSGGGGHHNRR